MIFVLDSLVNGLIEVLNQEAGLYGQILEISKGKTDIIIKGRVSELEKVVKLEQSLVLQIGKLEDSREDMTAKLSDKLGLKLPQVTLTGLAKSLQSDQANKLKVVREDIGKIMIELRDTNKLNSKLIKNSLEYIDFSLNLMAVAGTTSNNYGSSGRMNDLKKRNFFDLKL